MSSEKREFGVSSHAIAYNSSELVRTTRHHQASVSLPPGEEDTAAFGVERGGQRSRAESPPLSLQTRASPSVRSSGGGASELGAGGRSWVLRPS